MANLEVDDKRPITCQRRQVYDKVLNMSEISSGLVAVAWMAEDEDGDLEFNTINKFSCGRTEGTPLVRLSDAEAIIAKLSSKDRYGVCDECGTPYSFDPTDGGTICVKCQKDKIAQKDAEIIEQCRINGIGAERELTLLGQIERQSAALKLAYYALLTEALIYRENDSEDGEPESISEALAAIDALNLATAPTPPVSEDRKDAELLDYIQNHGATIQIVPMANRTFGFEVGGLHKSRKLSVREAIDAAMQEDKP